MAKRQKLNYNNEELTLHLKASAGQGMDALFSSPSPPLPKTPLGQPEEKDESAPARKRARTHVSKRSKTEAVEGASVQTRIRAHMHARIEEELRRTVLHKKHLSSFTFRFKTEERV